MTGFGLGPLTQAVNLIPPWLAGAQTFSAAGVVAIDVGCMTHDMRIWRMRCPTPG
jgi:hypothetical protein